MFLKAALKTELITRCDFPCSAFPPFLTCLVFLEGTIGQEGQFLLPWHQAVPLAGPGRTLRELLCQGDTIFALFRKATLSMFPEQYQRYQELLVST